MSSYAAPIEVVQAALHRCGEESITSLGDGTPAALVAQSNYEGIVRAAMTRHAWLFATETANLTLQGAVVEGDYVWAWIVPTEIININWVQVDGRRLRAREYTLQGRTVLTMDQYAGRSLQVVGTIRAPEGIWPDDFAEGIVTRLQALFLESLADKWQDGRLKEKDAETKLQAAIVRDKRQQPATSQEYNVLGEAWRTRGRRPHYIG